MAECPSFHAEFWVGEMHKSGYTQSANPFGVAAISKVVGDAGIDFEVTSFEMLG